MMQTTQQQTAPLSCMDALKKWGCFADFAIGAFHNPDDVVMENLIKAGATETLLKVFWLEVKHLRWASTFGQSPWETAASLAASLEARDLGMEFRRIGERYVKPFREAMSKQKRTEDPIAENGLKPFRVMLHERGDKFKTAFDCNAVDADDAAEQAEHAHPGCEVISCTWFDWNDTPDAAAAA